MGILSWHSSYAYYFGNHNLKIVAISDIHLKWKQVTIPPCDILISCGDYSFKGEKHVVKDFHEWMNKQEAGYFVSVQGNHELWVEKNFDEARAIAQKSCPGVHFIGSGEAFTIEDIKFYGSAVTPFFHDWAWNVDRGPDIKKHWDRIPDDTEILLTHGPAYGLRDIVYSRDGLIPKERVGCEELYTKVMQLPKLKHHFFGHIHGSYGSMTHNGKNFHNASICGESYTADNKPIIIEI